MTTVDKAVAVYSKRLQVATEQYTRATAKADDRLRAERQVAADKLAAAQAEHDQAVRSAEDTHRVTSDEAANTKLEGEKAARDEFDDAIRIAVQAPAGARVIKAEGGLALYLGDGRSPIAYATHIGSGMWSIEGAGDTVMCGSAMQARTELWKRCRPVPVEGA